MNIAYYIVYDEFDMPVIVGTAKECAECIGMTEASLDAHLQDYTLKSTLICILKKRINVDNIIFTKLRSKNYE